MSLGHISSSYHECQELDKSGEPGLLGHDKNQVDQGVMPGCLELMKSGVEDSGGRRVLLAH